MKTRVGEQAVAAYTTAIERELAKYGQLRGWDLSGMKVTYRDGHAVVDFGAKYYLRYQNYGTSPRLMRELEGRIVPLPGGPRLVKEVGMPGWVEWERNGVLVRKYRLEKWRHPGIRATNFVDRAVNTAAQETKGQLERARKVEAGVAALAGVRKGMARGLAQGATMAAGNVRRFRGR